MPMKKSEREAFDAVLEDVLQELEPFVAEQLNEVPLLVEDEPSKEILRLMGLPEDEESDLCGLHSGVPLTDRRPSESLLESSAIRLFRGPILRLVEDEPQLLRTEIRITLLHELGHHFGFSEEELDEMGYG